MALAVNDPEKLEEALANADEEAFAEATGVAPERWWTLHGK